MKVIENIIKDGSMPEYSVLSENGTSTLMESGTVAMTFQGSWMVSEMGAGINYKTVSRKTAMSHHFQKGQKEQNQLQTDLDGQLLHKENIQRKHGN